MRPLATLLLLLAACGSVNERGDCSASTDCPPGEYCARTSDGNVCWPDAVPPTVSAVTVSCGTSPCLRDGVLRVEANVADDVEVLAVEAALDGGGTVAMSPGGSGWVADVPLREFPFDYVEHAVTVTVTARDGARNARSVDADALAVTRVRFNKPLDAGVFGLTVPAVMADGTVVAAGANGKVYFVPWDGTGLTSVAVGAGQISAAPLILGSSVWIGSEDNRVYEVKKSAGNDWFVPPPPCNTTRPVRGALAATSDGRVIATSESGRIYSVGTAGCSNSGPGEPFTLGPVIDEYGAVYAVSGTYLRRLTVDADGFPGDDPTFVATTLGWPAAEPLVATTDVIAASALGSQGRLERVNATALAPEILATTLVASGGIALLPDGSIAVPERTETLSNWPANGAAQPTWRSPVLGGFTRTPIVVNADSCRFVISTSAGAVHALRPDGTIAWSAQFGTAALQPGNIYTPPGQPPGQILSTAYFAGADGVLHAVIVDGRLDTSAPWPKAFHDPQNTNRAGPQP